MLRQLGRLPLTALAGQAAAAECGGAAVAAGRAPQSAAAALQLFDRWQHWGSSQGGGAGGVYHQAGGVRHMSLWSSSSDDKAAAAQPDSLAAGEGFLDAAGGAADSVSAAAAAGTMADPLGAGLFSASAIVAAAAGAEGDVLAAAAEDSWLGTQLVQRLLTTIHDASGLPWWQSIVLCTLAMRLATLPVMIMQIKNTHRMSQARPEMEQLMEYMKEEQARGNTDAAMEHQKRVMAVWKKYNCNPFKSMVGIFVQAPVFIGFFSALRGFAAHKLPSLTEGGALWFTDLTVADPTYALPALAGLSFLATIELGAADGMEGQPEATKKKMKNAMRVVAVAIPLMSTALPGSVFMYWTASNIFSLAQSALLKVPFVKKLVGLPDLSALKKGGAKAAADAAAGKPVVTFAQRPTPAVQAAAAAAPEQQPEPAAATAAPKPVTHRRRPARARK